MVMRLHGSPDTFLHVRVSKSEVTVETVVHVPEPFTGASMMLWGPPPVDAWETLDTETFPRSIAAEALAEYYLLDAAEVAALGL